MNIAVVGAGILGRLVAYKASREGFDVTLLDKRGFGCTTTASWSAGGMLAPYSEVGGHAMGILPYAKNAMREWRVVAHDLDVDSSLKICGSLIVCHPRDEDLLAEYEQRVMKAVKEVEETNRCQFVDQMALLELEPELSTTIQRGIFIEDEGHLTPSDILEALWQRLESCGTNFVVSEDFFSTDSLSIETGMLSPSSKTCSDEFDFVIDCRGYEAKSELNDLRGVRGEALLLSAPRVRLTRPIRLLHPRYSLYVVPREDHTYYIGATSIETDDTSPIKLISALELLSAAFSLHPGFAEASILKTFVGIRPAFANNHPQLRKDGKIIRANGLYRHGYLLAPYLAHQCIEELRFHEWH